MAKMIPEEFIEKVRSETNIVDIIEPYVQLKKSGRNLFGLCPFHEERTPSFSVSEDKQIFHCFSCGRGGNVFKFIMDIENVSFPEAVIKVADKSGISLPADYTQSTDDVNSASSILKKDYQSVADLYHHILLKTEVGDRALKYLHKRKLKDDTINHFQIGYAPNESKTLVSFFQGHNKNYSELSKSGFFSEDDQGNLYDRFRDRVMFPITDQSGNIIAFSGRMLNKPPEGQPVAKYLNSPETDIFHKSTTLFHLAEAKSTIRKQGEVVLFEGFMDVISAYQAGVYNGVASMGTSLTDKQLYILNRITNRIVICYDGDTPGIKAAQRALKMLHDTNFDVGIVVIPNGMDPDEFIKARGADEFKKLIDHKALTPTAFLLRFLSKQYDMTNDADKIEFLNAALGEIVKTSSQVEQELYVGQLADQLNVSRASIQKELDDKKKTQSVLQPVADFGKNKATVQSQPDHDVGYSKLDKIEKSEQNLLNLVFHFPDVVATLDKYNNFTFKHQKYQDIFDSWLRYSLTSNKPTLASFIDTIPDNLKNLVIDIDMLDRPVNYNEQEVEDYVNNIISCDDHQRLKNYQSQIKQAAQIGDSDKEIQLTTKLINLRRKLDKTGS